jgi:hypothetical protein
MVASRDCHAHMPATHCLQVSKWGFAPGADDTLALVDLADDGTQALLDAVAEAEAAGPAAGPNWGDAATAASGGSARSGAGGSPTLTSHLRGLQLGDCKENLMADGAAAVGGSCRRQLCDPGAAAAVLQPLGEARVAALGGVELELDDDAEVELAAGGLLLEGDSFCVWPDGGEDEGSLPLMGSPAASGGSHTGAPGEAATQQLGGAYTPVGEALQYATPVMQRRLSGGCEEEEEEAVVEAFSPGLRGRMLCCLEPSVGQVSCRGWAAAGCCGSWFPLHLRHSLVPSSRCCTASCVCLQRVTAGVWVTQHVPRITFPVCCN